MADGEQQGIPGIFERMTGGGDPFPILAALRKSSPVMKFPGDFDFWGVFRYDDAVRVLRDPETFSSMVDARSMRGEKRPPTILFDDPPMHTRMRGLISRAFTPKTIELQRPAIEAAARPHGRRDARDGDAGLHRADRVPAAGDGHREHAGRAGRRHGGRSSAGRTRSSRTSATTWSTRTTTPSPT